MPPPPPPPVSLELRQPLFWLSRTFKLFDIRGFITQSTDTDNMHVRLSFLSGIFVEQCPHLFTNACNSLCFFVYFLFCF